MPSHPGGHELSRSPTLDNPDTTANNRVASQTRVNLVAVASVRSYSAPRLSQPGLEAGEGGGEADEPPAQVAQHSPKASCPINHDPAIEVLTSKTTTFSTTERQLSRTCEHVQSHSGKLPLARRASCSLRNPSSFSLSLIANDCSIGRRLRESHQGCCREFAN